MPIHPAQYSRRPFLDIVLNPLADVDENVPKNLPLRPRTLQESSAPADRPHRVLGEIRVPVAPEPEADYEQENVYEGRQNALGSCTKPLS